MRSRFRRVEPSPSPGVSVLANPWDFARHPRGSEYLTPGLGHKTGRHCMRKKFIAGNWKMNMRSIDGELLAAAVVKGLAGDARVTVAVCPPFPYLTRVGQAVKGSPVALGAQNCYPKDDG